MILMELEIKVGFPIKNLKTGLKMRRLTLFDVFILLSCLKDSPIPDTPTPSVTYPLSVSAVELITTNVQFRMLCMEQLQFNKRHIPFGIYNFMKNSLFVYF
tara:strand:- start:116 stop:418 length:303 start_codon:yes stop_codon:yes gene_type:complete